jgi:MFS family permease
VGHVRLPLVRRPKALVEAIAGSTEEGRALGWTATTFKNDGRPRTECCRGRVYGVTPILTHQLPATSNRPRGQRLGPLAERPFRRVYMARALSLFGDSIVPVALSFGVLSVESSPSALGFVLGSRFLALVVFLLVAGVLADRLPRKRMLIASDLARLAIQGATAALLVSGRATILELAVLQFGYGAGEAFFRPTVTGFVPQTVSPARLQQANALLATTTSAWVVLGPVVAGGLVATVGPGWAIGVDALTFLLSAVFLVGVEAAAVSERRQSAFVRDLIEGWRVFRSQTWLWLDGVYSALGNFAVFAPFLALGPVVATRSLAGVRSWAIIVAAFGAGSVLGGLVLLRLRPTRPLLVGVPCLALLASPLLLLALPAPTSAIAVGALAGGFGLSVFNTLFETAVQQHVSPESLSRVASIDWLLSLGLFPLGFALAGPAASAFGIRFPLVVGAVWILASTAAVLTVPSVRNLHRRG